MIPLYEIYLAICLTLAIKAMTKEFQFGHWIKTDTADHFDVHTFEIMLLQNIKDCIEFCKTRRQCQFFNFDHQANVCYLIGGNGTFVSEKKPKFSFGKRTDWNMTGYEECGNCSDYGVCKKGDDGQYSVCLNSGCGPPEKKNNAKVSGNMFSIGDKIQYKCKKRYKSNNEVSMTSSCNQNGIWSPVDFECVLEDNVYKLNNIFYQVIPHAQSWNNAKEKCSMIGGYLIDITSQEEQNFIERNLRTDATASHNCYWTGGKRVGSQFQWLDGTPFGNSYSNWYPGEPGTSENCLGIDVVYEYTWNDKPCDWMCYPICELI
ncbi:attractin-like [Mercenaria mercenaria]|uniref:attractin-like n=1 Tax=Mercenaria mercenaria TaxID=6596 RepID=UPI00234E59A5|nr:attractin-like [Mercenaria mercenaria]